MVRVAVIHKKLTKFGGKNHKIYGKSTCQEGIYRVIHGFIHIVHRFWRISFKQYTHAAYIL